MTLQGKGRRIARIRRVVQGVSLSLFLLLVLVTRPGESGPPRWPLSLYFDLDPLILAGTWLSTHTLEGLSLLALLTLIVTAMLGRVFCGWVCPFGVLHQIITRLRRRGRTGRPHVELFSRWQRTKVLILVALLVMALLGAHWIGVLDPIALFYRSTAAVVLPATQEIVEEGANVVYENDPRAGPVPLAWFTEPIYRFFRESVFGGGRSVFTGTTLILLVFTATVLLNLWRPRFYCRYVCPCGALLGLVSRRAMLRLRGDASRCTDCGLCAMNCPAAARPETADVGGWLPDECFGCWNCVASCHRGGLDFRFEMPWRRPIAGTVGVTRRAALRAAGAGLAGWVLFRITPAASGREHHSSLIRPPGSRPEREFLQRCVECGQCMKACPTNALHPALTEAGLEGLWSPVLIPRLGYCEYECNLCGQVCPTTAIRPLPLEEKKKVKIGLAVIDTRRCLPYAYQRQCIVCEEHCPIPTKAIYFVEEDVPGRGGTVRRLKRPRVDAELCTGCGICETKCVFRDEAAIRITSAGEDRHPENQPLLPGV